jgi:glucose/arabinose dehydrogenase
MIHGPDGRLWVAELAGPENAGTGRVVALSLLPNDTVDAATGEVLLTGLLKPVGLAVVGDALWLAAKNNLLRAPLDEAGKPGTPATVLADLPYNGRSISTLTVTPAGKLLYATSGARQGNAPAPGSAQLWSLDPANPAQPEAIASGLKNAYAQTFDAAGRLWITDVADDRVDNQPPPDELNLWVPDADFGWPQCYGDQQPARSYGGDESRCAASRAAVTTFDSGATPTSIVPSPWEADTLLVALWLHGVVMRVPVTDSGDNARGEPAPWISGLQNPQHLLVWADGALLVSDFATGRIYRITGP